MSKFTIYQALLYFHVSFERNCRTDPRLASLGNYTSRLKTCRGVCVNVDDAMYLHLVKVALLECCQHLFKRRQRPVSKYLYVASDATLYGPQPLMALFPEVRAQRELFIFRGTSLVARIWIFNYLGDFRSFEAILKFEINKFKNQ